MRRASSVDAMVDGARELALELAGRASKLIMERFEASTPASQTKSDASQVTATDIEIDEMVRMTIAERFPDHGYIGEETGRNPGDTYTWICDPIDGTRPFVLGLPLSTFVLALMKDGQPELAVITYPARDWTFVAEKGRGTTLNGAPVRVNDLNHLQPKAFVDGSSRSKFQHHIPGLIDAISDAGATFSPVNSAALSVALIAKGATAGCIFCNDTEWDAAAPKLILEEAGGRMTDLEGNDQRYDQPIRGFIASNGALHEELIALVQRQQKESGK